MKKITKLLIIPFVLFIITICGYDKCKAAPKYISLDNGAENSQYDITGNGKKDIIKNGDGNNCTLYINGKQVFKPNNKADYLSVKLYPLKKNIYFIISENYMETDEICGYSMYQYKSGKFEKLCDFYNTVIKNINNIHFGINIEQISDNKVTVLCHNQFGGTGILYWNMLYQYQNGKWRLKGNSYKITEAATKNKKLTSKTKIKIYEKPGSNKILYTIKPGDIITTSRLYIKNKNVYIKVVNSKGETGWFKSPNKTAEYFEEAVFPG